MGNKLHHRAYDFIFVTLTQFSPTFRPLYNNFPPVCLQNNVLTLISVNSAVSVLTLILQQTVPSLPLLSTPNLTTVTLCTSVFFQSLN